MSPRRDSFIGSAGQIRWRSDVESMTTVVWVPRKDCKCAIELFGEHDPGQLMGKGHGAKGEQQVGAVAGGLRPAIGRPDSEVQVLGAGVPLPPDPGSELFGGHGAAPCVEQNESGGRASGFLKRFPERGFAGELILIHGCVMPEARGEFCEGVFEQARLLARCDGREGEAHRGPRECLVTSELIHEIPNTGELFRLNLFYPAFCDIL